MLVDAIVFETDWLPEENAKDGHDRADNWNVTG